MRFHPNDEEEGAEGSDDDLYQTGSPAATLLALSPRPRSVSLSEHGAEGLFVHMASLYWKPLACG